jgi:hypothetical protein
LGAMVIFNLVFGLPSYRGFWFSELSTSEFQEFRSRTTIGFELNTHSASSLLKSVARNLHL